MVGTVHHGKFVAGNELKTRSLPNVALVVRTGKRTRKEDPWQWFVFMEIESLDKLAICQDDPHYIKFREEVLRTAIEEECVQSFEMEPRKDVKYS